MNFPKELQYAKSHEWVQELGNNTVRIGLTDYAQDAMGDIVFVNLPEIGAVVKAGDDLGEVESVKSVSNVYSPVGGTVSAVNEALVDAPEEINEKPYEAWLAQMKDVVISEPLLSADEYEAFIKEEA